MSRVNQPDTLVTLLREIQRRLRLLESTGRPAARAPVAAFQPARSPEWPGTDSAEWTPVVRLITRPGEVLIVLDVVADTAGEARVLVDGDVAATVEAGRHEVTVTASAAVAELTVEARRTGATGSVRVSAFALAG
ncbi:hypothetical protein SAMN05421837_11295 [Amycolatopsis pretoriensis]|uniref:Uncharacterized protein n=1 Tax=Amycolatopsis pretoriensis TaxID=218821 RepID=A0A1H5RG05_9PSEU|nr:hypothetical protein [Amycolatopsis pretoriensis]SEF36984.1 hypothetical protein SAMN05421837_11295 [Amycolatopsis pretoriensis]